LVEQRRLSRVWGPNERDLSGTFLLDGKAWPTPSHPARLLHQQLLAKLGQAPLEHPQELLGPLVLRGEADELLGCKDTLLQRSRLKVSLFGLEIFKWEVCRHF